MEAITREGDVDVTLFARSALPRPSQRRAEAVTERLCALAEVGVVDAVEHGTWPKRVPVDDCGSQVRDVYLRWADWARSEGVRLRPFFATRECYCPEAEGYTDWLVVPAVAMAVRIAGDLAAVYPHQDGGAAITVEDGLDALADTDPSPDDARITVAD